MREVAGKRGVVQAVEDGLEATGFAAGGAEGDVFAPLGATYACASVPISEHLREVFSDTKDPRTSPLILAIDDTLKTGKPRWCRS